MNLPENPKKKKKKNCPKTPLADYGKWSSPLTRPDIFLSIKHLTKQVDFVSGSIGLSRELQGHTYLANLIITSFLGNTTSYQS